MTYAKNSNILAADYNLFAGLTATAAASSAAAQNTGGYLWGVGFGDRGYGQATPNLTAMIANASIGQEWQNLRTTLSNLATWQNTAVTLLPPSTALNTGADVIAHEQDAPSSNAFDIQNLLTLLDTNRLNYQLVNMTLTSNAGTTTRASTWGSGVGGITATFNVSFASENAARYFFNTGGELRLALSHPNTSSPRNISWNTVLSGLNIAFRANATARIAGTTGTGSAIGYYQLTTAFQTIYNGLNTGTGAYTVNDYIIEARSETITGLNGAKGSSLSFRITLTDEQTNAFSDIVALGTVATVSHLRATNVITLAAPTCSVTTGF